MSCDTVGIPLLQASVDRMDCSTDTEHTHTYEQKSTESISGSAVQEVSVNLMFQLHVSEHLEAQRRHTHNRIIVCVCVCTYTYPQLCRGQWGIDQRGCCLAVGRTSSRTVSVRSRRCRYSLLSAHTHTNTHLSR